MRDFGKMEIEKNDLSKERIESERLLLIPISMKYKEETFREFSKEITAFMHPAPAKDISETEAFIRNAEKGASEGRELHFAILSKDDQEFLGIAGIERIDSKTPELWIRTKKSTHGKGYGKEAVVAVKTWADNNIQYDYLLYPVAENNTSSRKIAETLGGIIAKESDDKTLGWDIHHFLEYRIYPDKKLA